MTRKKQKNRISRVIIFFIMFVLFLASWMNNQKQWDARNYTFLEFEEAIEQQEVKKITIEQDKTVPTGEVRIYFTGEKEEKILSVSDVNAIQNFAVENEIEYSVYPIVDHTWMWYLAIIILILFVIGFVSFFVFGKLAVEGNKSMSFGKSRAKLVQGEQVKVKFRDVAGLKEEKEELVEIVSFLQQPQEYLDAGARIPRGILLSGSPGTGKTLLAKSVAGEAGVPFFTISGSDFVEMFVGVGAARVRDLFTEAKKCKKAIIFIDEIDAVARRRGSGIGGGNDEREQTLNQLLVEMDGFEPNESIIIIAATNRVDVLDPAILRPGRFDRQIAVNLPDVAARKEILEVHAKSKKLCEDVDLEHIARTTAGFSGADIENLLNEAAIHSVREQRMYIMNEDISTAFIKVGIGTEKHSAVVPQKEREITAYHEAGHALLFHLLSEVGPVHTVSIIPTGNGAAGYTMPLPENDHVFLTKTKIIQDIMVCLGGRIAEELIFKEITTGASQDIKQATQKALAMVTRFGMSDKIGMICYYEGQNDAYPNSGDSKCYGEETAKLIDQEVKDIIDGCYQEAKKILEENIVVLHDCAKLLLEKEKINREQFEQLF